MTAVEHNAELTKAGANIANRWQAAWFFAKRYPLGAVGLAIMALFIFTALFATTLSPYDPTATDS